MKKILPSACHRIMIPMCIMILSLSSSAFAADREFYELKIYHIENQPQSERLENYLEKALLPALHRAGIYKVGVFKPIATDENAGKLIYLLTPFHSLDQFLKLPAMLEKDNEYQQLGMDYINAAHDNPCYVRFESILLMAFVDMPFLSTPKLEAPASERIYELRSYEGPTEKLYRQKVKMFNEGGEIPLFKRLEFNAIFYGEVISGCKMPNLMYITTFNNMESRDQHWKDFFASPEWTKLKTIEEYKNTVSKAEIFLLHPTVYSDL